MRIFCFCWGNHTSCCLKIGWISLLLNVFSWFLIGSNWNVEFTDYMALFPWTCFLLSYERDMVHEMQARGRNIVDNGHYNSRDKQQGWVFSFHTTTRTPQKQQESDNHEQLLVLPSLSTLFIESPAISWGSNTETHVSLMFLGDQTPTLWLCGW